jgi:TolB-like protein/class 3 adenylate cyclase/Flp pilus assembly protein TadD
MPPVRRLTAILAADVAGYSRLMGADEEVTHERLQAHLRELVEPKIKEHRGRIVKNTGDGFLTEFHSVVDAVRCAAELQRAMIDREAEVPDEQCLRFRIGINLGDVIADGSDIFGDGVNVAARLEGLAEPGGICVSSVVREQIRDRLPFLFDDLGEQSVKNIARPVRIFALRPETIAEMPIPGVPIAVLRRRRNAVAPIAAVVAAVLIIAVIAWWVWLAPRTTSTPPAIVAAAATPIAPPLVAPRLSAVVLPFANLSNDPDQQYFADGITEDLTTDLSRIPNMLVISRNSAFTYKDKPINAKQIGRELGVRYLLEGSVQRSGKQVRVNAQLIAADADAHLWAERFDGDMAELFALQNEITSRTAIALNLEVTNREATRPTDNPDALDYILRARAAMNKPRSPATLAESMGLVERALSLDPGSVEAKSLLVGMLVSRVLDFRSSSEEADVSRAEELAAEAVAEAPGSPVAHFANGEALRLRRRCAEAIPEYETVLAMNRNSVGAMAAIGRCKIWRGAMEDGIAALQQAIRLSPRDPGLWNWYFRIGEGHLLQSHVADAIVWLEKARNANPAPPYIHAFLAAAYALSGDAERATAELSEARQLGGKGSYSSIAQQGARMRYETQTARELCEATFYAGLRKAGMPEE